ncbi:MAG: isopenicillin N synthase family dioxygenase [Alphaproteobacteria bacterium]
MAALDMAATAAAARPPGEHPFPLVDAAPLLAGRPGALADVAAGIARGFGETGVFYLAGHGIPNATIDGAFAQARRFFALPVEERAKLRMNDSQCGWQPPDAAVHKTGLAVQRRPSPSEAYKFALDVPAGDPDHGGHRRFRDRNQWPAGLPGFSDAVQDWLRAFDRLSTRLLPALATALDMPADTFDASFARSTSMGRYAWYPAVADWEEGLLGSPMHTDLSFLSMIPPADAPGLEVRLPDGSWVEAPRIDGAIMVLCGITLERWSNGRFVGGPHRVLSDPSRSRLSTIYFCYPALDALIECLPTCRDRPGRRALPPIAFGDLHTWYCDKNFQYVDQT